jgi:phasin family protein
MQNAGVLLRCNRGSIAGMARAPSSPTGKSTLTAAAVAAPEGAPAPAEPVAAAAEPATGAATAVESFPAAQAPAAVPEDTVPTAAPVAAPVANVAAASRPVPAVRAAAAKAAKATPAKPTPSQASSLPPAPVTPAPRRAAKPASAPAAKAPLAPRVGAPRPPVRAKAPAAPALVPAGIPAPAALPSPRSVSRPFSNPRIADMNKLMTDFKIPGVDFEAFLSAHRKNFEAVTAANQLALEGMQAVVRRQSELVRQSWEESTKAVSELMNGGAPEDKVSKQVDLMKGAFDKAIANVKEVTELLSKSNGAAADLLSARVRESIEEVKSAIASAMPKH